MAPTFVHGRFGRQNQHTPRTRPWGLESSLSIFGPEGPGTLRYSGRFEQITSRSIQKVYMFISFDRTPELQIRKIVKIVKNHRKSSKSPFLVGAFNSESNYAKPPDVPPLLWPPLQWIFKISKVQFFKSTVKSTSKYPVAAVTIERTFFDDILTASYCHRCHKRTLPTILAEFQSARNELGRQKSCKMTKIATTPEGPRTDFSSIFHPNPQKSMQLDFKPAREAF